jgi:hypothetical protein
MLVAVWVAIVSAPFATAAPRAEAPSDLDELPAALQKYVPGSPAWSASPWMTAPSCRDRGGDFSVWVEHVIADTPELLRVFQSSFFGDRVRAEDRPRNEAILAGYRTLAAGLRGGVPAGYCVNDIKQWAGKDPEMKPFGFAWGIEKTSIFGCTDTGAGTSTGRDTDGNAESSVDRNRWVGAERAPCDGFHLRCDGVAAIGDRLRCAMWNVFSARYVDKVETLRAQAINAHPALGTAPVVEKTPTWRTALYIAGPIAVLLAAALLGWGVIVDRRRETPRHQDAHTAERGIDDDTEQEK